LRWEPLLAIADTLTVQLGGGLNLGRNGGGQLCDRWNVAVAAQNRKTAPHRSRNSHVLQDLRDGLQYLGQNSRIRTALIQLVILFSVFAALAVLAVRMAEVIPA